MSLFDKAEDAQAAQAQAEAEEKARAEYLAQLNAAGNLLKNDMFQNILQILLQNGTKPADAASPAIQDYLRKFVIPNFQFIASLEFTNAIGEKITIRPMLQFAVSVEAVELDGRLQ